MLTIPMILGYNIIPYQHNPYIFGTGRGTTTFRLDLSIFWVGTGSGRAEKNSIISGRKNPAHDNPTGRIGPQFSGRARAWVGRQRIL
jgi:hypothetical protein